MPPTAKRAPARKTTTPGTPRRHWLLKSEPQLFSYDDLLAALGQTTCWEGVRNYQARNYMRDDMRRGDLVLFYHSNADPAGVAGVAEVVREAYPDPSAFDPASDYFDPKSRREAPVWLMVDVRAVERFPALVPLDELRATPALAGMELLRRGSRLSVQPVTPEQFAAVCALGRRR